MDIGVGLLQPSYYSKGDADKKVEDFSTIVEPDSEKEKANIVRKVNFELKNGYPHCCNSHYLDSVYRNEKSPGVNDLMKRRLKIYFEQYPPHARDASKLYTTKNTSQCNEEIISQVDLSEITVTDLSSSEGNDSNALVEDFKFNDCRFCSRERPPKKSTILQPQSQPPLPKKRGQSLHRNYNTPLSTTRSQKPNDNQRIVSSRQSEKSKNRTSTTNDYLHNKVPTSSSYYTPRSSKPFSSRPTNVRCSSTGDLNNLNSSPSGLLKAAMSFSDLVKRLEQLNCSNISKKNASKDVNNVSDCESIEEKMSLPQNTSTDASSLSDIFLSDEFVKSKCPTPVFVGTGGSKHVFEPDKPCAPSDFGHFHKVFGRGDSKHVIKKSSELTTPSLHNISPLNFDLYPSKYSHSLKEKFKSVSDNQFGNKTDSTSKSNCSVPARSCFRTRSASMTGRFRNSSNPDLQISHRFWIPDVTNVTNTLLRNNDRRLALTLSNYGCQAKVIVLEDLRRGFPNSIIQIEAPSKQHMQWCSRAIDKIYTKWNLSGQLRYLR